MSEKYLHSIYYNSKKPGSYGGVAALWQAVKRDGNPHKLKYTDIKDWLNKQEAYSLHKPYNDKFKRSKVLVGQIDELWGSDLMDLRNLSRFNRGFKYLAVFIDIFSRFLWIQPMKNKTPEEMIKAMSVVIKKDRKPRTLRTDMGSEYTAKKTQDYLKKKGIYHLIAYNVYHANYAERVIRTVKGKLFRFFTKNQTYNFIDNIQDIVDSYNNSKHSFLKLAPSEVTKENEQELYEKLYLPTELKNERIKPVFKFNIGDKVRIVSERSTFKKGYHQNWTDEIFIVDKRIGSVPPIYRLKDQNNEEIKGSFYAQELQLAHDTGLFKIEKVLRYRRRGGVKQALIRWYGYGPKFDSWIDAKEIKSYKNI